LTDIVDTKQQYHSDPQDDKALDQRQEKSEEQQGEKHQMAINKKK